MGRDMLLKFEAPPIVDLPGICAVAIAWASAWWLDKEVPTFKGGNPASLPSSLAPVASVEGGDEQRDRALRQLALLRGRGVIRA
jgi:hypothetical protein